MIDFSGQTAVVTGAGRGLGRAYALDLARRGASVVVNDIGGSTSGVGLDTSVADEVVAEIRDAGGSATASYDDVSAPGGPTAIVGTAMDTFGRLDALISNAGISQMVPLAELTNEQWRRMLEIHLDGSFHLAQRAMAVMKQQGYGRLVLVASQFGAFGSEMAVHYSAAKGGVIGLTNALALEGAAHGINVNALLPVGRSRLMTEGLDGATEPNPLLETFFAETTAERVVPMATFLASRECTLTHQLFSAVAGRYSRVFVGLTEGWMAPRDGDATAEDVVAHLEEITSVEKFEIPGSAMEEIIGVLTRLGLL